MKKLLIITTLFAAALALTAADVVLICRGAPIAAVLLTSLAGLLAVVLLPVISPQNRIARTVCAALAVLIAISPLLTLLTGAFILPSQYSESYLGALEGKVERLDTAGKGKIVIVGGSSVAFGIDCKMIEFYTGRPAVNFGLYATLGTEMMLELLRASIQPGDIIVIAPETDAQTMSDYFNAEATWQAIDGNPSLLTRLPLRYGGRMLGGFYDFASGKLSRGASYSFPASGIYGSASFDEYGDIAVSRPSNTMLLGYDPMQTIEFDPEIISDSFINYLNDFASYASRRGAMTFFSFPPMNVEATDIGDDTGEGEGEGEGDGDGEGEGEGDAGGANVLSEYYGYLASVLSFPVISDPSECLMGAGYFYDTNFHVNDAGRTVNTTRLIRDIYRAVGYLSVPDMPMPDEPELGGGVAGTVGDDTDTDMFTYAEYGSGLIITGVTDEGRARVSLTIPSTHDGTPVVAVGEGALTGCNALTDLTFPGSVRQFVDGAFSGAPALVRIWVAATTPEGIAVGEELFRGAPDALRLVFVARPSYEAFAGNYSWYAYFDRFELK